MVAIRFWQARLAEIYPNNDKTPDYIMSHIYTACSDVGRLLLRSENDPRRNSGTISALSWLMAMSSHFGVDYETAIISRFPTICFYCLQRPCRCDRTGKQARRYDGRILTAEEVRIERLSKYNSIVNPNVEVSFEYLIGQLAEIYPSNRALLLKGGQGYVVGKMLEEGGELHRSYSDYLRGAGDIARIAAEIADVTAWVISCWDLNGENRELSAEFASLYVAGCFRCKRVPCECPDYSITRGQEEAIREVAVQLRVLRERHQHSPDIEEAIILADQVAASPSPEARRTLGEKMKSVLGIVGAANSASGSISGLLENASKAYEALLPWIPK